MLNITLLGLGAMGSRMGKHLLTAGHNLTVYNRTLSKTKTLEAAGAKVAASPANAVAQADVIISMVTDDKASQTIWLDKANGAINHLPNDSLVIECSTLSPAWVQELASLFKQQQHEFLEAPVVGSRPQAEMASDIHHVGPVGTAGRMKLAINALFAIQVSALSEVLSTLENSQIDITHAIELFNKLPVTSPALAGVGSQIASRSYAPLFPIKLVEKDLNYLINTAINMDKKTPITQASRYVFHSAIDKGYGEHNISGVAQLYL